ncbi:hypothetical protein B0T14DRAFT_30232, partial [Immersiella caudata]
MCCFHSFCSTFLEHNFAAVVSDGAKKMRAPPLKAIVLLKSWAYRLLRDTYTTCEMRHRNVEVGLRRVGNRGLTQPV